MSADPTQALLLALASGDGSAASQAIAGLVDADDPIAPVLAQLMSARATDEPAAEPPPAWPALPDPDFPIEELEQLRHRNDQLAAALGACYLCWGEDPVCPICEGAGVPGASPPRPRYFAVYVLPVLNRLRRKPAGGLAPAHDPAIEQRR